MKTPAAIHEHSMRMAIELAAKGGTAVRPNPLVGAVIVKNGDVIGKGYHTRYGALHAEREALADAGDAARGATMYVTLEPCNHYGKTPPCTEGIIEAGIASVVIGMRDPNPDVAGNGIERLQQAGIPCTWGVLEEECRIQNEVFLVNTLKKQPFVFLKVAQSLDGFIAPADGNSKWITGLESRTEAHRLRAWADAVCVGTGTLRADDPALTVRHLEGRNPRRILLTDTLDLPFSAQMFRDEQRQETIVLVPEPVFQSTGIPQEFTERGIEVVPVKTQSSGNADIQHVLDILWERGVCVLMVEGGAGMYSSFLEADAVDRIDLFIAPKIFGSGQSFASGIQARSVPEAIAFDAAHPEKRGSDTHLVLRRKKDS